MLTVSESKPVGFCHDVPRSKHDISVMKNVSDVCGETNAVSSPTAFSMKDKIFYVLVTCVYAHNSSSHFILKCYKMSPTLLPLVSGVSRSSSHDADAAAHPLLTPSLI